MGELVFLMMLTAFILYKLFSVFGRLDIQDRDVSSRRFASDCCESSPGCGEKQTVRPVHAVIVPNSEVGFREDIQEKFSQIRMMDADFEYGKFVECAKRAYDMINEAVLRCDTEVLSNLVSKRMLTFFMHDRDFLQAKSRNRMCACNVDLANVSVNGKLVTISLNIEGESIADGLPERQIRQQHSDGIVDKNRVIGGNTVVDSKGSVVGDCVDEKNTTYTRKVQCWAFSRHMSLDDKIWQLVSIS